MLKKNPFDYEIEFRVSYETEVKYTDCLDVENLIIRIGRKVRENFREKNILFPIGHVRNYDDIEEDEIQIFLDDDKYMGTLYLKEEMPVHELRAELEDSLTEIFSNYIEFFKTLDYDEGVKNLENEQTLYAYRKLMDYAEVIIDDKKLLFHYTKKASAFGAESDLRLLLKLYRKQNKPNSNKGLIRNLRNRINNC